MKIHKNKKVFLIEPIAHGNGGWCGSDTVLHDRLGKILSQRNPYDRWNDLNYSIREAELYCSELRICLTEDPNDAIYVFNCDDLKWDDYN